MIPSTVRLFYDPPGYHEPNRPRAGTPAARSILTLTWRGTPPKIALRISEWRDAHLCVHSSRPSSELRIGKIVDLSVAILAGGESRRMGRDKGLVKLESTPLVEHVYSAAKELGLEVFIATNRPHDYSFLGLRTVTDRPPLRASLVGLRTALEAARTERVLVLACDMPLVRPRLIKHMAGRSTTADALIPRFNGQLQPFLAIYKHACIEKVETTLEDDELEMQAFLRRLRLEEISEAEVRKHDPQGLSFLNVNTEDDLVNAKRILARLES